ncbi:hypothetical protein [Inquilinus sp.]|uniref:hypothetical protein n=1 Tax=Inquilinus sp. TaxID=1932117 RepID=UPI0037849DD6
MVAGSLGSRISRVGLAGILVALAACGPTPSESQLNYASQRCSYGDPYACDQVGPLSYQAQAERQQQDTNTAVAAGLLAVGGIALGAALADDDDGGRYYHRRGGWGGHRGGWGGHRGRW